MEKQKGNSKRINGLIFSELIKRGYSLEGNTRIWNIADSKLWYITPEQSQAFLDLEQSEDYQRDVIQKEIDLIKGNIKEILEIVGKTPANIIDLGCGDGKKAILFINKLKTRMKLRYCPIDISSYLVEKAIKNIKSLDIAKVVEFKWNISDFENLENISSLLRDNEYKKNFILFLGNTLGNFEINELLYQIRSGMKEGDFVLIGNGLDNRNSDDILKSYENEEVNRFLINIPIKLGLDKEDIKFGARFKNSRVECYYTIVNDSKTQFQNRTVYFNKGDQIIVALSYKYQRDDFLSYLKMYFDEVKLYVSPDRSYGIALCKK